MRATKGTKIKYKITDQHKKFQSGINVVTSVNNRFSISLTVTWVGLLCLVFQRRIAFITSLILYTNYPSLWTPKSFLHRSQGPLSVF